MCQTQSNVSAVGMSDLKLLRTGSRERTGSMTFSQDVRHRESSGSEDVDNNRHK